MRKKIILFLGLLGAYLSLNFGLNLNAKSMFKDNPMDNLNAFRLSNDVISDKRVFNVVSGTSDINDLLQNKSFKYVLEEMPKDNWSEPLKFSYQIGYEAPSTTYLTITSYIEFKNNKFKCMNVYLECPIINFKGLFYSVSMIDDKPTIVFRCDAEFPFVVGEYNSDYYVNYKEYDSNNKINSLLEKECYKNFDFSFLYGMKFNPLVDGKPVTKVISDYDNPMKLEDIHNKIKVSDKKGNATLYFSDGDYGEEDSYDLGTYSLVYIAIDDFGNVTKLVLEIEIKDIRGPIVKCEEIVVNYKEILSDDVLKSYINVTDSTGVKSISYDFDSYKNNFNKKGSFPIVITATDNYDNVTEKSFLVTVIDEDAPIVSTPSSILSFDNEPLTINDIKKKVTVKDDYDGEISDFTIIDVEDYQNKSKGFGKYRFDVEASDSSKNKTTYSFFISYCDGDFPEFNLDDLIYVLPDNRNVFKNDIEELLKNLGYLNSNDSISITSNIKNIDSSCIGMKIKVNNDKEYDTELLFIDNEIRVNKFEEIIKNENDYTFIIIGSIIGFVLLSSLAMSVIIYKKKH